MSNVLVDACAFLALLNKSLSKKNAELNNIQFIKMVPSTERQKYITVSPIWA